MPPPAPVTSSRHPTRRDVLKWGAACAAGSMLPGLDTLRGATGSSGNVSGRPNILILHTDEQSAWTLGTYGARDIATPHLDSLARDGAVIPHYFCNSAVCTPSRGTMISGLHSRTNGALGNDIPIRQSCETFAHVLAREGWQTGYVGKWHLDGSKEALSERLRKAGRKGNFYNHPDLYDAWVPRERGMGFEENRFMWDIGHWKSVRDTGRESFPDLSVDVDEYPHYMTDWIAGQTIDFIRRHRDRPFCYVASIPDPHTPITVREPHASMFDPADVNLHPSLEVPDWFAPHASEKNTLLWLAQQAGLDPKTYARRRKAVYLGMMKRIDEQVGRILAELDNLGIADNTIVIHTSDHGEHMGQAGVFGKAQPFEVDYHVPMLVRWPERIAPGTVVKRQASHVDLKPTLLAMAGIPNSGEQEDHGRDFSPLLEGHPIDDWDDTVMTQTALRICGLITPRYFISYFFDRKNEKLTTPVLFDRKSDPDNLHNLAGDGKYADTVRALWQEMVRRNEAIDSPDAATMRAGYS